MRTLTFDALIDRWQIWPFMTFIVSCEAGMSNPSRLGEAASAISSEWRVRTPRVWIRIGYTVHTFSSDYFCSLTYIPTLWTICTILSTRVWREKWKSQFNVLAQKLWHRYLKQTFTFTVHYIENTSVAYNTRVNLLPHELY